MCGPSLCEEAVLTFAIRVKDGTGAGRKTLRQPPRWTHRCTPVRRDGITRTVKVTTSSYSCPVCGARRPKEDR